MNSALSVDEYDLLDFFGAIPTQRDADVSWTYNDSAYSAIDGNVASEGG
jgi:hypothetical protein